MFEYFYGDEPEQFRFYRIPKLLVTDPTFSNISTEAKFLYGLLLDRTFLSKKNGWVDKDNRIYIIYSIEEIIEDIHYSRQKVVKLLDELDEKKGAGLITRVRRGMNLPNLIYVKNFASGISVKEWKYENHTSGSMKLELPEVPKSYSNDTKKRDTYQNDNHPPPMEYLKNLVQQLQDGNELNLEEKNRLKEFSCMMTDLICCGECFEMTISHHTMTRDEIIQNIGELKREYLIHMIQNSTQPRSNPKKYWITLLYHESLRIKNGIVPEKRVPKRNNSFHNFTPRKVDYEEIFAELSLPKKEEKNINKGDV